MHHRHQKRLRFGAGSASDCTNVLASCDTLRPPPEPGPPGAPDCLVQGMPFLSSCGLGQVPPSVLTAFCEVGNRPELQTPKVVSTASCTPFWSGRRSARRRVVGIQPASVTPSPVGQLEHASPFVRLFYSDSSAYICADDDGVVLTFRQGEGGEQGKAIKPTSRALG